MENTTFCFIMHININIITKFRLKVSHLGHKMTTGQNNKKEAMLLEAQYQCFNFRAVKKTIFAGMTLIFDHNN